MVKIIRNKLKKLIKISTVIYILMHQSLLYGLRVDNNQPLLIKSHNFEIDYTEGYALYSGAVVLNQGSRHLESDQLYLYFENNTKTNPNPAVTTMHTPAKETKKIKEIKAIGDKSLVKYSEDIQQKDGKIRAEASIMKFSPQKNLLTLEKHALIEQNGRRLTSELLHYNTKTEVAYTPKLNNKRTKVILG